MRKAAEREEMAKQEAAKRTHQELTGHPPPPGHPLFSPDFRGTTTSLHPHMPRLSPFPPGHPLNASPGAGAPSSPNSSANRPLFPPGFAPAPPPPGASSAVAAAAAASMQQQIEERRRLEELSARVSAERQYAERMSALATDPLVRLQMAGVTPEIPGASHFRHPFGLLGAPPGKRTSAVFRTWRCCIILCSQDSEADLLQDLTRATVHRTRCFCVHHLCLVHHQVLRAATCPLLRTCFNASCCLSASIP